MLKVRLAVAAAFVALFAPASATALLPDSFGPGDLHVVFPALSGDWGYGYAVGTGDLNGDGRADIATSSPFGYDPRTTWVTFTPATLPATQVAGEGEWRGFEIVGPPTRAITGLGDVNGDGRADLLVATESAAYVVFGRSDGSTVDLDHLGTDGFTITGLAPLRASDLNSALPNPGDQNGDGVDDVVLVDSGDVKVIYTPADPAGKTIDAAHLGDGGYTLTTDRAGARDTGVASLGDLNHDGRDDLTVSWDDGDVHVVGVIAPGAGDVVDVTQAPEQGRGFELYAKKNALEQATTLGDRNGDGRRDVAVSLTYGDCPVGVVYTPAIGTRREICPTPTDGSVAPLDPHDDDPIDVGDQDGDGIGDYGSSSFATLSIPDEWFDLPGYRYDLSFPGDISGTLHDRNGDGVPEILTTQRVTNGNPDQPVVAVDVTLSAPRPVDVGDAEPTLVGDQLVFRSTWSLGDTSGRRAPGLDPRLEFADHFVADPPDVGASATAGTVTATLSFRADWNFDDGVAYRYRWIASNDRGMAGAGPWHEFVYHKPSPTPLSPNPPPFTGPPPRAPLAIPNLNLLGTSRHDVLRGKAGNDRIKGGAGGDSLFGLAGNDKLYGQAGNDRLTGGPGRDLIDGGSGNDQISARDGVADSIYCGAGRDTVVADKHDHVRGCERVLRR